MAAKMAAKHIKFYIFASIYHRKINLWSNSMFWSSKISNIWFLNCWDAFFLLKIQDGVQMAAKHIKFYIFASNYHRKVNLWPSSIFLGSKISNIWFLNCWDAFFSLKIQDGCQNGRQTHKVLYLCFYLSQ